MTDGEPGWADTLTTQKNDAADLFCDDPHRTDFPVTEQSASL